MAIAFFLADQDDEALLAGDAGVKEIALQHRVVLREDRNDHSGILGPLALVDGRGVGGDENVELAELGVTTRPSKVAVTSPSSGSTSPT